MNVRPAGAGFRAQMPGKPQSAVQELASPFGPLQNHMAVLDLGSQAMVVTYADIPAERATAAHPDAILDGVRKGILGGERRLDQELRLTMNGFPARQLLVTDGKARQGLRVRIALAGRRLHRLFCAHRRAVIGSGSTTRALAGRQIGEDCDFLHLVAAAHLA